MKKQEEGIPGRDMKWKGPEERKEWYVLKNIKFSLHIKNMGKVEI